ncbi:glycosyltransferase [Pararhodobacter aggregans]|uniref:glycosyltransferase n=1 Tax=Pararhodobacter aggregans TaxID=404875 RepID=UPI003A932783
MTGRPADPAAPLISVIVAVHQVAPQIAEAIASLRAQSLPDFEALVVDDGSTDDSGRIAAEAFAGDARFRLLVQPNRGLSAARNAGLDQARGAFVAFLDGDDALAPDFLRDLHAAMHEEGTDWAACGITLVHPGGEERPHPALHACDTPPEAGHLPLTDACEVARVFPSAWNKLYRRSLFEGLRFPEGSWFEDHEVFWALARRAPRLAYRSAPLYHHRRDRPGQITGTDSDRVFDVLRVLDRLGPLILGSAMTRTAEGYARLAARLIHERALVIRDPARRARFLTAAHALLQHRGMGWQAAWDPEISRGLGLALEGVLPLSVVVQGDPGPALAALDAQGMADFELVVLGGGAPGLLPSGRPVRRLDAEGMTPARLASVLEGRWVLLLAPGEVPLPEGLMRLVNLGERLDLPLALGALERRGLGYHDGWTDNRVVPGLDAMPLWGGEVALGGAQALSLYPALGNRLMRRDLLAALPGALGLGQDGASAQMIALESALRAGRAGTTRLAVLSVPDRPATIPGTGAARRLLAACPAPPALPRGWQAVILLRLAQLRGGGLRLPGALLGALREGWLAGDAAPDPGLPRWVRALMRLR